MTTRSPTLLLTSLIALTGPSCFGGGGDGGDGAGASGNSADCRRIADKLRSCNLLSSGTFECGVDDTERDRCLTQCLVATSCETLELVVCQDVDFEPDELAPIDNATARCAADCEAASFTCDNGEEIPERWRCDFEADCMDASDEQDCDPADAFTCDNGATMPRSFVCDDYPDCPDASDERDCPRFTCGSGELVPLSYQCDQEADCMDASDEDNCAQITCQ